MPLLGWISRYASWDFLTHVSWAHMALYLHHGRFLFTWGWSFLTYIPRAHLALHLHYNVFLIKLVGFSWLICLEYIWPCTSAVTDFLLRRSSFLNSRISGTFGVTPPLWQISHYAGQVFSIHMPWAYLALHLYYGRYLITHVKFSWLMYLGYIWPYALL